MVRFQNQDSDSGSMTCTMPGTHDLRWVRPPRQARSQATLDRILDAAAALTEEKSFDESPVAEIVKRAGSSVGAFYTRFEDKDALRNALYDRFREQALATADEALAPERWEGAQVPEILSEVVRFLVGIYREQRGLMRTFLSRGTSDPEFGLRSEKLTHQISSRLSALLLARREELGHPDPELAAAFGFRVLMSSLDQLLLFDEIRSPDLTLSDEDFSAELTRTYLSYLGVA